MTLQTSLQSAATPEIQPEPGSAPVTIETRFGEIDFPTENMIIMPRGLLGYGEFRKFGLTALPGDGVEQFMLLQSLEDQTLSFVVAPYNTETGTIDPADIATACHSLAFDPANIACLLVVSTRQAGEAVQISVNLRAPVIVDTVSRVGHQYVLLNNRYSVREIIGTAQKS